MDEMAAKQMFHDFFASGSQKDFDRGEVIILADEEPVHAYWIVAGYVKAVSYSKEGHERNHFLFGPNEIFSTTCLFDKQMNQLEFVAATKLKTRARSLVDCRRFIKKNPHAMVYNINILINVIYRLYSLHLERASDKVGYTILLLADRFGIKKGEHVFLDLTLTQQELAEFVKLTRESVGKAIATLEEEKCVVVGRKYILVDTAVLKKRFEAI